MTTTPRREREPATGREGPMNRWLAPDAAISILVALILMLFVFALPGSA